MVIKLARPSSIFAPAPTTALWISLPAVVSSLSKSSVVIGSRPFSFLCLLTTSKAMDIPKVFRSLLKKSRITEL